MFRLAVLLVAVAGTARAQDANCDFRQNVQPGQTYYVYSPGYPGSYTAGVQCRWQAVCPAGYNCRLVCNEINLPESSSCSVDRLLISPTGDALLNNAQTYCGRGSTEAVSSGQAMSIGLISSRNSPGGRFSCQLTAVAAAVQPDNPCNCGYQRTNRIVGGVETGVNEFPMMAGVVDADIFHIRCGGAILSRRHVLTAAHCLENLPLDRTAVIVGEHNVNVADSPATQAFLVSRVTPHPRYNYSNFDYDMAVLELQSDIVFSDRVGPVCLPFKFANTDLTGAMVTILGWGTLFPGGPTSNVLMKTQVQVISRDSCARQLPSLTPRQICTFTPNHDACQDDSGGPLLLRDPASGRLYLPGLISYGRSCASGSPGVNTLVSSLLDWIVAVTPGASYCRN